MKRSATSNLALEPDLAPHFLHQLPGYRQPEAGATKPARYFGVRLLKGLKDGLLFVLRYPDPRVADAELNAGPLRITWLCRNRRHRHLGALGELDRVAH